MMKTEGQKVLKPLYRIRCREVWVPRFWIAVINQVITIEDRRSQIAWPAWSLSKIPIQNNNPIFDRRSKKQVNKVFKTRNFNWYKNTANRDCCQRRDGRPSVSTSFTIPSLHYSQYYRRFPAQNNNPLLQSTSKHKLVNKHSNRWIKGLFLCFLWVSLK